MSSIFRAYALKILRSSKLNCNAIRFTSSTGSNDSNNDGPSKGKDESKNDKETKTEDKSKIEKSRHDRLQSLLDGMTSDSVYKIVKNVETSKPKGYRIVKDLNQPKKRPNPKETENIDEAAAQVAETLGGDTVKIKKELLSKLKTKTSAEIDDVLGHVKSLKNKKAAYVTKTKKDDEIVTVSTVQEKVVDEVADNERATFLSKLKTKSDKKDIASVVSKMKVEKFDSVRSIARRQTNDEFSMNRPRLARPTPATYSGPVKLFGGARLGIFSTTTAEAECQESLNIWDSLEKHELAVLTSRPPSNYYEKMIQWTEQGKIWHFPIDNEQGLDEEAQFSFEQHVFLEQLLDPWCPKNGPIRIFMELVCIGLSKNPYLTVKQKHEHIEWYKNYFDEKKEVLERMVEQQELQKAAQPNKTPSIS